MERVLMKVGWFSTDYGQSEFRERVDTIEEASVVTSLLPDGRHAPVLDIDFHAELLPSSTEDHYHLYLDVPMTWFRYRRLLKALAKAGVIEDGYMRASIKRRHSAVRKPGLSKETPF